MLNKSGTRELAYVVTVDNITPIEGYDRVELAHVGGWTIVVGKNEFQTGNLAIYFEIDSQLPEVEPFTNMEFLAKKKYKVKTQKMCKSTSQGLLMSAENFGWTVYHDANETYLIDKDNRSHSPNDESRFLTNQLNVTYAVSEDNVRKAHSEDKYKKMAQRRPELFSKKSIRWLMRREWGKKLLFFFFGKKKDKKGGWPEWVTKTDEERIENMTWILNDEEPWIATEKIDGTSTTFTMKRKPFGKYDFYICSRNVVFDKPDKPCFYASNVYYEMALEYNIEEKMKTMLKSDLFKNCNWITIQGETYGESIQKRDYHMHEHHFMAFNFVTSKDGRWNSVKMRDLLERKYGIPCVPIVMEDYHLPNSVEELRAFVDSDSSVIDGDMREGLVFRSQDATKSFKCVSPDYLLKYHQ